MNSLPLAISVTEAIFEAASVDVRKFDGAQVQNPSSTNTTTLIEAVSAAFPYSTAALKNSLTPREADVDSALSSDVVFELAMIGTSKVSENLNQRALALMRIPSAKKQEIERETKVKLSLILKRAGQTNSGLFVT